jgi:hypothetical protein
MRPEELSKLPKETLIKLFEILRRDQRTIDGFWFLQVENSYGIEKAIEFDAYVWNRIGRINAKRLKEALGLGTGIPALVKAIELDPLWFLFGYEVKQLSIAEAAVVFTDCLGQKARLKMGKELFPCRSVDEGYFTGFAKTLDPRIEVQCISCPPERYSDELWCEWRFTLMETP